MSGKSPDFILPSENFISLFRENQTNNNVNSLGMDTPLDYRHVTAIVRELSVELREGLNTEGLYNSKAFEVFQYNKCSGSAASEEQCI